MHSKHILSTGLSRYYDDDGAQVYCKGTEQETGQSWRLPTINEQESLVGASAHTPALPSDHPFADLEDACWSSRRVH